MENQTQLSVSYEEKYEPYAHSVGTVILYLQWCTKYCYKMFRKEENRNLLSSMRTKSSNNARHKNHRIERSSRTRTLRSTRKIFDVNIKSLTTVEGYKFKTLLWTTKESKTKISKRTLME